MRKLIWGNAVLLVVKEYLFQSKCSGVVVKESVGLEIIFKTPKVYIGATHATQLVIAH